VIRSILVHLLIHSIIIHFADINISRLTNVRHVILWLQRLQLGGSASFLQLILLALIFFSINGISVKRFVIIRHFQRISSTKSIHIDVDQRLIASSFLSNLGILHVAIVALELSKLYLLSIMVIINVFRLIFKLLDDDFRSLVFLSERGLLIRDLFFEFKSFQIFLRRLANEFEE